MLSDGIKALLIPPIIALALYLVSIYFLVPLYRRRQLYSQYLPVSLTPSDEPGIVSRARGRILESLHSFAGERIWHRRSSSGDANFNFGDEELEEDIPPDYFHTGGGGIGGNGEAQNRRLSRDLEAGFRDDSDDEHETDTSQRRVQST